MVVDDSPEITYTVKDGLEGKNSEFTVICADSGKTCLNYLEENLPPDLILLDIMMPEMSGWEVLKKIRTKFKWENLPIIFLTAKNDNFSRGYGKLIAYDYIEKPFEIEELKERINDIFAHPPELTDIRRRIMNNLLEKIPDSK